MKYSLTEELLSELMEAMEGTDIEYISVRKSGLTLGCRKEQPVTDLRAESSASGKEDIKPVSSGDEGGSVDKEPVYVTAMAVGHYRDYIPPSRKVLTKLGKKVKKGEKIGAIESMKTYKDVTAPCAGVIRKKLVKHGDPVQYGQKLFEVESVQ